MPFQTLNPQAVEKQVYCTLELSAVLNALQVLTHVILLTILKNWYYYLATL